MGNASSATHAVSSPTESKYDTDDFSTWSLFNLNRQSLVSIAGGQFFFIRQSDWSQWRAANDENRPQNEHRSFHCGKAIPSKAVPNAYDVNLSQGILTASVSTLDELRELCEINDLDISEYTASLLEGVEYLALQVLKFAPWQESAPEPELTISKEVVVEEDDDDSRWFTRWWKKRANDSLGIDPPLETIIEAAEFASGSDIDLGDDEKATPMFVSRSEDDCSRLVSAEQSPLAVVVPKAFSPAKLQKFAEQVESGTSSEDEKVPVQETKVAEGLPPQWSRFQIESDNEEKGGVSAPASTFRKNFASTSAVRQGRTGSRRPRPSTKNDDAIGAKSPIPGSTSVRRVSKRSSPSKRPASKRRRQTQDSPTNTMGVTVPRNK